MIRPSAVNIAGTLKAPGPAGRGMSLIAAGPGSSLHQPKCKKGSVSLTFHIDNGLSLATVKSTQPNPNWTPRRQKLHLAVAGAGAGHLQATNHAPPAARRSGYGTAPTEPEVSAPVGNTSRPRALRPASDVETDFATAPGPTAPAGCVDVGVPENRDSRSASNAAPARRCVPGAMLRAGFAPVGATDFRASRSVPSAMRETRHARRPTARGGDASVGAN